MHAALQQELQWGLRQTDWTDRAVKTSRVRERQSAQSAAHSMPNKSLRSCTGTELHNSASCLWRDTRITYLKSGLDGDTSFVHDDIALYALLAAHTPKL